MFTDLMSEKWQMPGGEIVKFQLGLGTIAGIFGGIAIGFLFWFLGGIAETVIVGVPANTPLAFFGVGFAITLGAGIAADLYEVFDKK